jgi:hypothetical protein
MKSLTLLASAALLLAARGPLQAQDIAAAAQGADTLHGLIDAWNTGLKDEAPSDANRAQLQDRLRQALKQLAPIKDAVSNTLPKLDQRLQQLQAAHGAAAVADWPEADRADDQRTQDAKAALDAAGRQFNDGWDSLHWLVDRAQRLDDPFHNAQFKTRFGQLTDQVDQANAKLQGLLTTCDLAAGPGGGVVVVQATCITAELRNDKDMAAWVNGVFLCPASELGPGRTSAKIRLGDHRALHMRALTWDVTRRGVVSAWKGLGNVQGNSDPVRGEDPAHLYFFDRGAITVVLPNYPLTDIMSSGERYEWAAPTPMPADVGQSRRWPEGTVIVPPQTGDTPGDTAKHVPTSTGNLLNWEAPIVSRDNVEFGIGIVGQATWQARHQQVGGFKSPVFLNGEGGAWLVLTVGPPP